MSGQACSYQRRRAGGGAATSATRRLAGPAWPDTGPAPSSGQPFVGDDGRVASAPAAGEREDRAFRPSIRGGKRVGLQVDARERVPQLGQRVREGIKPHGHLVPAGGAAPAEEGVEARGGGVLRAVP